MRYSIESKILIEYLACQFSNGTYRLTFDDVARAIFRIKCPNEEHIRALRVSWQHVQKKLREVHEICAMLVSAMYFADYPRSEPKGREAIQMCIAGYGGRKAAGIRLLSLKDRKNDPMMMEYFAARSRNLGGMVAAVEDRITVEWKKGHLTKRVARKQVDDVTAPVLPYHAEDFKKLIE
jgi:hypothetical protein